MSHEHAKEEPKGLFTSIFDGVKNAGSAVVDGVGKVSYSIRFSMDFDLSAEHF
jgi:hypothetical protein